MYCNFEMFLAKHCAPVLFYKKPAALFPAKHLPKNCAWVRLWTQGFRIHRLHWRKQNVLMLIYHPKLLSVALSHEKAQARLVCMGYPTGNNYMELLRHLQKRFKEADEFPHEVGFFLGYPPEDVIGFMDSRKSCKMCGQWKVYGDEKRAAEVFAEYKRCREVLLAQVKSGGTVFPTALPELVC